MAPRKNAKGGGGNSSSSTSGSSSSSSSSAGARRGQRRSGGWGLGPALGVRSGRRAVRSHLSRTQRASPPYLRVAPLWRERRPRLVGLVGGLEGPGKQGLGQREVQGAGLGVARVADWAGGTLSSRRQLSVCAMAVLRNRRGLWGSELTSPADHQKRGSWAFRKPPPSRRLPKGLVHQRTGTQLHCNRKRKHGLQHHITRELTSSANSRPIQTYRVRNSGLGQRSLSLSPYPLRKKPRDAEGSKAAEKQASWGEEKGGAEAGPGEKGGAEAGPGEKGGAEAGPGEKEGERDTKHGGHKNGRKGVLSGSSFFTWFMVIALLGVWTSVAVIWFELVDYEEVLAKAKDFRYNLSEVLQGKLGVYDADGLTNDGSNENIDSLEEVVNILAEESSDWFCSFLSFLYDIMTPFEMLEEAQEEGEEEEEEEEEEEGKGVKKKSKTTDGVDGLNSGSPQGWEGPGDQGKVTPPSHLCCCHCWQRKPRLALVT
ncbi:hypothetical protein QTO34_007725 [Cnephaeus nilssonii]|uniref:Aspartyl beta-hydroxylase/Triadin domain-containing protein n=1 Tax=Cnephaeus nilssonii TaxID=3371016 RepID=A0AA40HIW3_CNENI|nr:hypothetical protein QTO34_007725 [Eptesicus nilssonii]